MRGIDKQQSAMFSYVSPEARVPPNHPLRPIREMVDESLKALSPVFDEMYASFGRPSIAPEKLLRIDFLLTERRDAAAAKRFFRRALLNEGNSMPRVINVDKNPAYPRAVEDLKADGIIGQRCRLRQCKYLNNVVEQSQQGLDCVCRAVVQPRA